MWLIIQIAAGVFAGLLVYRFVDKNPGAAKDFVLGAIKWTLFVGVIGLIVWTVLIGIIWVYQKLSESPWILGLIIGIPASMIGYGLITFLLERVAKKSEDPSDLVGKCLEFFFQIFRYVAVIGVALIGGIVVFGMSVAVIGAKEPWDSVWSILLSIVATIVIGFGVFKGTRTKSQVPTSQ
ncbi:MAG: hypothetical protein J0L93_00400 [Deltaproteobacteria bacterium]|nr:hypothetical protein [Deltaproteobacteria bacterium]